MNKNDWYELLTNNLGEEFCVLKDNHGWNDDLILIRGPTGSFRLDTDGRLSCMCIFAKHQMINETVSVNNMIARLQELKSHECCPWPG